MKYVLALGLIILLLGCTPGVTNQNTITTPAAGAQQTGYQNNVTTVTNTIPQGKGRLVFTLADQARDMGVTNIKMTVDTVEAYDPQYGWVTLNGDSDTYDLLQLRATGDQKLLADKFVDAKTYTQVRMKISSVMVTDANGEHNAALPNNQLIINTSVPVAEGAATTVQFDFMADQSLRLAQDGSYVFLPVVRVLTYNDASVTLLASKRVTFTGTEATNVIYGTSATGVTAANIRVPDTDVIIVQGSTITTQPSTTQTVNTVLVYNTTVYNTTTTYNNQNTVNSYGNTNYNTSGGTSGSGTNTSGNATV